MSEIRESSTPVREFRTTAVSSVAAIQGVQIPPDADGYTIYAPSNTFNLQMAPRIAFCGKSEVVGGDTIFTNYTTEATDLSAATDVDLDSLDTGANSEYFYVASHYRFGGLDVDVDAPNTTGSTMTGFYYDGTDWSTDISITDGTSSTSATLAIDGNITWTVPSNWATTTLNGISNLYVVRFQVSTQLDSDTLLDGITLLSGLAGAVLVKTTTYVFGIDHETNGALNIDENGATSQTITVNWLNYGRPLGQ